MEERLQKLISACGLASRRAAEDMIRQGRVCVNGSPAVLGDKADLQRDSVTVDGVPLQPPGDKVYILLNKPRGYVTTLKDEKGRKTVADLVTGCPQRVYPVGRLDMDSEGLLLLTNDGALAHQLMHPSHAVEKTYHLWVTGGGAETAVQGLAGMDHLEGEPICRANVALLEPGPPVVLAVTIHQGKNRQIRRMCQALGLQVQRLRRVSEGPLTLGSLPVGHWRYLTGQEIRLLQQHL